MSFQLPNQRHLNRRREKVTVNSESIPKSEITSKQFFLSFVSTWKNIAAVVQPPSCLTFCASELVERDRETRRRRSRKRKDDLRIFQTDRLSFEYHVLRVNHRHATALLLSIPTDMYVSDQGPACREFRSFFFRGGRRSTSPFEVSLQRQ